MKTFPKRTVENSPFGTENVLRQVCTTPNQGQSLGIEQLRTRIKIMDAIEKEGKTIELDDKLHEELCAMLNSFQFAMAHRDLLVVIDDVLGAESLKTH